MATPSIGAVEFIRLDGQIAFLAESVEEISRPGVDGVAFHKTGARSKPCQLRSFVDLADAADCHDEQVAYQNLRGTLQTITFGNGETYVDVMAIDVVVDRPKPCMGGGGGLVVNPLTPAFTIEATWTVQLTTAMTATP